METSQIVQFLEAVDVELVKHTREGERLDLYLLGRDALLVRYGLSMETKDVDMVTQTGAPELEAKACHKTVRQRDAEREEIGTLPGRRPSRTASRPWQLPPAVRGVAGE